MTTDLDTAQRRWCASLAKLVQPDRAVDAADALVAMLPMLSTFPPEVWSSRSALDAVATCRRRTVVPSYSDIASALGQWVRDNPSRVPALAAPDGLHERDWIWVRYFERRRDAGFPSVGGLGRTSVEIRANLLSLVRAQSKPAHDYLVRIGA